MTESNQVQAIEEITFTEERDQVAPGAEADLSSVNPPSEEAALPEQELVGEGSPTPEPSPPEDSSQPSKLAEIIPTQLALLRQHHYAVVTTDEVEAVHKMRVTTRRLQASLDLLEGEVNVRPLKRRLRRWRRMLSSVRNYDVFLLMIEQEAASRRGAREQYELLTVVLQKRRAKLAARVKKYLAKVDVVEQLGTRLSLSSVAMSRLWEQPVSDGVDAMAEPLAADFGEGSLVEPGDSPEPEPPFPAIDEQAVAMRAAERLEQRMAEFNALAARSHPTTDPRELHQLRIAAKRVRYLLEAVTAMGFGEASQALTWLRGLQDRIGDWHDLEALEEEIIRLVSRRRFTKEHLRQAAGLLLAAMHLQKQKKLLVSRLFPVRVPAGLSATSRRLVRALRRSAVSGQPPAPLRNPLPPV
ncbi:MAG: CHAD domain-containing protein [Blastocatellia bacterium]